jgi:carbonic anhydrase
MFMYMQQEMRKEEEKLAQEQEEKVKENLKKLEEIQSCTSEKTIQRLSWYYDIKCENTE